MNSLSRRQFLKKTTAFAAALPVMGSLCAEDNALYTGGAPEMEKLGWHIGCQLYSLRNLPFMDALKACVKIGLKNPEVFPFHPMKEEGGRDFRDMTAEEKKTLKSFLKDNDFHLLSMGVGSYDRKTFELAKELGMKTLVCEPSAEEFDDVEKLVQEYDINIAIHNHPKEAPYWHYQTLLNVCAGRDPRIGACLDNCHFVRSGLDMMEAVRALKGRIISLHYGDMDKDMEDITIGTGICPIPEMLKELKAQGFKGGFMMEFERNPGKNLTDISHGVRYTNELVKTL